MIAGVSGSLKPSTIRTSSRSRGKGRDRIKICTDTDGDGRADQFTVFATDLSIPTSICFANGGVIVHERGQTLFLKDTDGDGRADERRVLFTGWECPTPMPPPAISASVSTTGSGARWVIPDSTASWAAKQHKFGMGVFRFKADGSELEFIRSSNNNTWGLGITEDGTILGSTANGNAAWYTAMPNRFYEFVRGLVREPDGIRRRQSGILPGDRESPSGGLAPQIHRGRRQCAVHSAGVPRSSGTGSPFVAEPTGHLVGWFRYEAGCGLPRGESGQLPGQ